MAAWYSHWLAAFNESKRLTRHYLVLAEAAAAQQDRAVLALHEQCGLSILKIAELTGWDTHQIGETIDELRERRRRARGR